jgi:PAS domain S-box-containing protein
MIHPDTMISSMLNLAIHQVKDLSITLLNAQGLFLFWNTGAKLLDGYDQNEIIGKHLNTLHPDIERNEKLSDYLFTTANKNGRVKNIGRRVKKDGTIYIASVIINSIFDEAGNQVGFPHSPRVKR